MSDFESIQLIGQIDPVPAIGLLMKQHTAFITGQRTEKPGPEAFKSRHVYMFRAFYFSSVTF